MTLKVWNYLSNTKADEKRKELKSEYEKIGEKINPKYNTIRYEWVLSYFKSRSY